MYFYVMAKIWDAITADDLPTDDLKWIATSIGLDVAKKIWRRFAGNHVACPARMTPSAVRRYMKENYDKTIHQIAFETGLSERTIYRYMSYSPSQEKDQKQISLF